MAHFSFSKPVESFNPWNHRLRKCLSNIHIPGIIHISIVGSHRFAMKFHAVHDIDLLFIFQGFGTQQYVALKSQMTQIATNLSSHCIVVFVEMRSGPLKPNLPTQGLHHVQLHVLPYNKAEWNGVLKYPGCREWVDENDHLVGHKLSGLSKVSPLSVESVLRDVVVLKQNVNSSSAYSRIYVNQGNQLVSRMESIPLTRDQYAQMLVSCTVHASRNASKVLNSKLSDITKPNLPSVYQSLLQEMSRLDSQFKRGNRSAVTSAIKAKRKIGEFLCSLEDRLLKTIGEP